MNVFSLVDRRLGFAQGASLMRKGKQALGRENSGLGDGMPHDTRGHAKERRGLLAFSYIGGSGVF